ncbi:hypothetical protein B1F79_03375 [Coxiella-like endosymbiont of Rhipicephalus sanguineus]|nr:hypothetical protein [Coxiella-like endosymbiont of Rhipicephalus sanguineus]
MINQALMLLDLKSQDQLQLLIDLFCSIGNFLLLLAKYVKHVVEVEADFTAVEQAEINIQNNSISNKCRFFCEDLFHSYYSEEWAKCLL